MRDVSLLCGEDYDKTGSAALILFLWMASLGAGAPEDSIGMMAARADSRRMNVEADMSIDDTTNRLVYTSKKITDAAFTVFKELQEQRQLCDVTIRVGDHDFVAHRVVLAATSPYFRGMFTGVCVCVCVCKG